MSIRSFGRSGAVRGIATAACLLGFAAFMARMVMKVQNGQGLEPYESVGGYSLYPLGTLILVTVFLTVAGLGTILKWWRPPAQRRGRRWRRGREA